MSDAQAPPLHVTLLRHGDLVVVDLAERGTLIPRSEVRVDDGFLRDLAAEMEHVVVRAGSETTAALARIGGLVFSHLLTEPARRRLRDAPPSELYLRLDERLVHVPWELCHDGEAFLLERFRIGRQVITGRALPEPRAAQPDSGRLRVLVVADPTDDLPQAAAEGEQLCALLDDLPGVDVTLLAGRNVRRVPLLGALQEHDAVHFAGHSHFDPAAPARSGWRLSDGILTAAEIARLSAPPFLVFSNSCHAGASAAWSLGGVGYDQDAFGIGSAFLLAGVPNYVGTFWAVHDAESIAFATSYYRVLAESGTLGEALARARRSVLETFGAASHAWASYVLYGDPALRPLLPARAVARERGRGAGAAARAEEVRFEVSLPAAEDQPPTVDRMQDVHLVGREVELERLATLLAEARGGSRQAVFVSGPPGIGKTTLLDAFLARVRRDGDARIGQGQAVEHYGAGEPYLPLLEALGRLGAGPDGRMLVDLLRRHAPTWLAQLPALVDPSEHEALARRSQGSTRERMLRELADLIEAATRDRPLVLVLEDLHWSDHSTIEAISYVAQRRAPARLLLVGTLRPAEVAASEHPLRAVLQELRARRRSADMKLEVLTRDDVASYLTARLGVERVDSEIVAVLHRRTEGHPLFLVNVVDFALREGLIEVVEGRAELRAGREALSSSIPEGLLPMIERHIEALTPDEQQVLETAAVVGAEFSTAAVASALGSDLEVIDDRCEALAWRGQFLRAAGMEEWPDGTLAGRYRFVHALYQNVLYQRVAEPRRVRLHRRIAERKAAAYGNQALDIAGELAAHFEAARDTRRALEHRVRAGDVAVRRHADREAVEHYRGALHLLEGLGTDASRQVEVDVLVKLATRLMATEGYASQQVEHAFDRAYALSRRLAPGPYHAPLLRGLVSFHHVRARLGRTLEVGRELLALCERGSDPVALVQAHYGLGAALYDSIDLEGARRHLNAALALYDPATHPAHVDVYGGYDPGVACRSWLAWVSWLAGEPDRAVRWAEEGLALALDLAHPFSLGFAYMALGMVHLQRGDAGRAAEPLGRARQIAEEDAFPYLRATVVGLLGWLDLLRGKPESAIARGEESVAAHEATGAQLSLPGFTAILGYAKALTGRLAEGLEAVERGLEMAERTGQRMHMVMLSRVRADLLTLSGPEHLAEAEEVHRRGVGIARGLGSPTLEMHATLGLCRLLHGSGRRTEAREVLEPLYGTFSEGFDTGMLRDARTLLEAC